MVVKKNYEKPEMQVVQIKLAGLICRSLLRDLTDDPIDEDDFDN